MDVHETVHRVLTNGNVTNAAKLLWLLKERGGVDVTEDLVFHLFLFWRLSPSDEPVDPLTEGKQSLFAPYLSRVWEMFVTQYVPGEDADVEAGLVKLADYYVADQYIDDVKKQFSILVHYQETATIAHFVKQLILQFTKMHINKLQDALYHFLLYWWNMGDTNSVQHTTPVERLFVANILYFVDDDIREISYLHPIVKGFLSDFKSNRRELLIACNNDQ